MTPQRGAEVPDSRGRTELHLVGRGLTGNPDVVVRDVEVTSDGWHVLRRTTYDRRRSDGGWTTEQRETYDRGNGAAVLPVDPERSTVLLVRQFRFPAYVNGHPDGVLLEAAAGLLDDDDPETAVRRETLEELGLDLRGPLVQVGDLFMSPGSVTERLHLYVGTYSPADRTAPGGGPAEDGEDIEVVELPLAQALAMCADGRIRDGKTVLLLQWVALHGWAAQDGWVAQDGRQPGNAASYSARSSGLSVPVAPQPASSPSRAATR